MLASTPNNNSQSTISGSNPSITTGSNVSSPTNSIKNIKCEPYATLSPSENTNNQNILEEHGNNTIKTGNINLDNQPKSMRELENTTSVHTILRPNSNSINSSSVTNKNAGDLSPTNGSDHSNSSNMSSQTNIDNPSSNVLQEINDKSVKKNINSINNPSIKEEDNEKSNTNSSIKSQTSILGSLVTIKEEPEGINNLINIKKEDANVSPDMSPVGFGAIPNVSTTPAIDNTAPEGAPGKLNENNAEKLSTVIGSSSVCNDDLGTGTNGANDVCANQSQHNSSINFNNNNNNSSGITIGNCMDYMQQQNHIFVFSTQLANKGAESVISGQYPTIIAYHCTQPATKNFLEDFFIKNPMKMTKLQRQNSLNMYGITIGNGSQPWLGSGSSNPISKIHQKGINSKMNFASTNTDSKVHARSNLRSTNMGGFSETGDALVNENDNMCWEQTRNNSESTNTTNSHTHIKMLDGINIDAVVGVPHGVALSHIENCKSTISADINGGDNSIPSLQGVKVPDENLTPQQRQHREEQLAKLKKMNQFLFPENGNDFRPDTNNSMQGNNPLGKLSADSLSNNLSGIMLTTSGTSTIGPQQNHNLNPPGIRNMTTNLINQNKAENIGTPIEDESIIATDMMSSHEIASIQCNNTKGALSISNQNSLQCGSNISINSMSVGNITNNIVPCVRPTSNSGGHSGNVTLMPNSPEVSSFSQNCVGNDSNLSSVSTNKVLATGLHGPEGMPTQMDWSKLQNQFYDERIKNSKITTDVNCIPNACRSTTGVGNLRANLTPVPVSSTGQSTQVQAARSNQGPPPPYHPTQRCASVPIATQSPNPTSPNNPTSNLSLPSPRTTGTLGIPANSPNLDIHVSTTMSTTTSTSSLATSSSMNSAMVHSKNNFQPQEISSPTNNTNNNNNNITNTNRSRNNVTQYNSNPSTPISHMSPKDIEPFNTNTTGCDLKSARPSPQRSRTPLMSTNNNNMTEPIGVESRFSNCSPGLNFSPHMQSNNAGITAYKPTLPIERQNSVPSQGQFCRRSDNVPLNPNSNRLSHNKMNLSFDPISSLAQMSQQLTSCVPMNSGMGNIGEMNMSSNVNIDGMISTIDGNMELCNSGPGSVGNISVPQQMNSGGSFNSNNCHLNTMLNPMGQRLLNPKMCGGFSTNSGGMREGSGNFHGMMPGHPRMMGRMPFGNFNVSPNIQVKASTPNTIQYMPIRPQNNANNMRMPPSLDFLQRYANPQMSNASNILDNSHMTQNSTIISSEQNKISNNGSNNVQGGQPGINFFQNCNQMGVVNSIGVEQEELSGNMLAEMNMSGSMIRNMRPMRQHSLGNPILQGTRMQVPGMAQFPGTSPENLECNDPNTLFSPGNNSAAAIQMFGAPNQQKQIKGISGLCQNMNPVNVSGNNMQVPNPTLVQNESPAMQTAINASPTMQGGNPSANIMQSTLGLGNNGPQSSPCATGNNGNGNINYKPFVGHNSNDLKYAQQYHSFQQQLYATSTRNQQVGGANNMAPNPVANAGFFNNK